MPVSIFIGLGPSGRDITEQQIRDFLEQYVPIQSIRCRGTCAFADVESEADAQKLIDAADKQHIGNARLSIQVSRPRGGQNGAAAGAPRDGPASLFVGLGPAGRSVTEDELRSKLEEAAPVKGIRHRGECAFVDVDSVADAERIISTLRGTMIGQCRLSVQFSKDSRRGGGGGGDDRKRGREDSRDRRDRRRDDSRDRRDRRRSDSRDRRRDDSRERRERRRSDSRDRRRRSPSY